MVDIVWCRCTVDALVWQRYDVQWTMHQKCELYWATYIETKIRRGRDGWRGRGVGGSWRTGWTAASFSLHTSYGIRYMHYTKHSICSRLQTVPYTWAKGFWDGEWKQKLVLKSQMRQALCLPQPSYTALISTDVKQTWHLKAQLHKSQTLQAALTWYPITWWVKIGTFHPQTAYKLSILNNELPRVQINLSRTKMDHMGTSRDQPWHLKNRTHANSHSVISSLCSITLSVCIINPRMRPGTRTFKCNRGYEAKYRMNINQYVVRVREWCLWRVFIITKKSMD